MTTKYSEALFVRVEPSLKAALENLLSLSTHEKYESMGDLLREILSDGVKSRLKKVVNDKADCACIEVHTCQARGSQNASAMPGVKVTDE